MTEDQFEKLARLIKEEGEDIRSEIKADIAELRVEMQEEFRQLKQRVGVIEVQLERLAEQTASNAGFAKEIDGLRDEVKTIKRQLATLSGGN